MELINIGNWLISAKKTNNFLLVETKRLIYKYWDKYNYVKNYFFWHMFFRMIVEKNPKELEKIPMIGQMDAHYMMRELDKKYDEKRCQEIMKITSVHKLTYKYSRKNKDNITADKLENLYKKLN